MLALFVDRPRSLLCCCRHQFDPLISVRVEFLLVHVVGAWEVHVLVGGWA